MAKKNQTPKDQLEQLINKTLTQLEKTENDIIEEVGNSEEIKKGRRQAAKRKKNREEKFRILLQETISQAVINSVKSLPI